MKIMVMLLFGTVIARCVFTVMTVSGNSEDAKMVAIISSLFIAVFLTVGTMSFLTFPDDHSKQRGSSYSAIKMFIFTAIFAWYSFIVMIASDSPEKAKMLVIIGFHLMAVFLVARIIAFFAFPKDHSD